MSKEEEQKNDKEKEENINENNNKSSPSKNNTPEKEEKMEYSKMIGNYILFDQIGMGTFSKVTRAVHLITEQIVAVKILEKEKIEDDVDVERIIREIEILKNISHPNIAQMFETFSTVHNIYFMMEYIEGGDLFDYINSNSFLPEDKACYFFRQLIGVIEYLHTMGISHRDIKPENILLDKEKKNIKVIDFGLSNYCSGKNLLHSSCGSPCYASPEMLSGEPYQGITTDLWSSGIVLYSMLVGALPFDEQELQTLYEQIKIGKFYLPSTLSLEAIDFLKRILMVDPKKRIGLNEIKNHAWFNMEKNPMYKGINIEIEEFPCNMKVASYIIKHFFKDEKDINIDTLVEMVKTNACNKYTATYYLTKMYILCIDDKYNAIKEDDKNNDNKNKCENNNINSINSIENEHLLYSIEKVDENEVENKNNEEKRDGDLNLNKDIKINNDNKRQKARIKTEENEIIINKEKKCKRQEKKKYPSLIINNSNNSNNNNINAFEENNNIVLTENDYIKNNKKIEMKDNNKNMKQKVSSTKNQKDRNKIELSNLNSKNLQIISNNDIKKNNKSKLKINPEKKISNINLKSLVIKRKNITNNNNNIRALTERINDYGKKEININKISNIKDNKHHSKKRSSPSSNNFNFYVINNIIHKDRQELNNDLFNYKMNNQKKNKSSSLISKKIKNIPITKTNERINSEMQRKEVNDLNKNENKKDNNKSKLKIDIKDNNISKKISNTNILINRNMKTRRNSNANKNSYYFNNIKNLSTNNFNYINTNYINNTNNDKLIIKNIINIINNSNCEKKKLKKNNLTLGMTIKNSCDNNFTNISYNSKGKKNSNNFVMNYIKQKNACNYLSNNTSNNVKRQTHQRNFSNALRSHLTNFKTDVIYKSNNASISKNKEKLGNDSLLGNPYYLDEKSFKNNKYIKKVITGDFGNNINKSHYKNKVI
jgi:serine/threonine protein kinase